MSNQPNYSNEDINQLLGLEFRPVTLTEEENNELVFDNESIEFTEVEEPLRKSWSSNPWAKLGLIAGVLGFVFLGIGTFVTVTGNLATSSNLQANQSENNEEQITNQVADTNSSHNTSFIIPRTQPIPGSNQGVSRVPTNSTRVAQNINHNHNLSEEERFLSGNTTSQQITIGQRATAVLESSLISESNGGQNDFVERFVVTLSTPLTNQQGVEVLPTGTPMLVAVRSVHDSGKVTAVVESVVKNGQEIPLPDGAMFLRDAGGNPLMASLMQSGQRERMEANATTFVMGALSKTGELLNRGSTSTFISGGNFSQSQQFDDPNYIGGLLEGGFTPLAERMNQQHENRLSTLDSRTPLWIVEQGTTVEIFVNQTINF